MSSNGYRVIDTDSHIREYVDVDRMYGPYIDPEYRESYERLSLAVAKRREAGRPTALFMHPEAIIETSDESRPLGVYDTFRRDRDARPPTRSRASEIPREVHWEPSIRLRDMDEAHVDISVIFPSHAASYCTLRDVGFETALHRAHHRYMSNYCCEAEGRLRWSGIATMRDVGATIEELTYWAEHDDNFIGMLISPACPDGRLLDNPDLGPLYERSQDLDLPILVHGGVLRPPYTAGAAELDHSGFLIRSVYQPWAGMTAIGAMIGGGVFDLFPRLRAGVFETGAGWMPWLIEQFDDQYEGRHDLVPFLQRKPSEVLAGGQVFHAVDSGERYIGLCVQELGEDMWLFATDYPHPGTVWPDGVPQIMDRPELSESAKRKILGENAVRLCPRLAE